MKRYIHGGEIRENRVRLDFSVNLNPLGTPETVREAVKDCAGRLQEYPDPAYRKLREALAGFFGIGKDEIICGNGASELIMASVAAIRPERVLLTVPDFYGYERAAAALGTETEFLPFWKDEAETESEGAESESAVELCKLIEGAGSSSGEGKRTLVMLSNPNNPTGRFIIKRGMTDVIEKAAERGFFFLLDESFLPFVKGGERESLISETGRFPGLMVLRSLTKQFAMPGVRLGAIVTGSCGLREKIAEFLPEWNVSIPAEAAGMAAVNESNYVNQTPVFLAESREMLKAGIEALGRKTGRLTVFPSAVNYLLIKSSLPLYSRLLEKGILIRDCENFRGLGRGYYRIAVKSGEENEELLAALGDLFSGNR
ncbi:MAG: aminotransferase class I/II-fold pyridoxal phosphate-dependent enzyme [Lachnospiraceae bacterium]|nr:aminotransferase class I/II-fold pyridoxal phosphate-dependent enzyme [Lachnospiraceae bacterium]